MLLQMHKYKNCGTGQYQRKQMSEIWELFDSFCCKFCYKQYNNDLMPVFICRNQHYCCKYCLETFYVVFKTERPNSLFQCPVCEIPIQAQFIKEYKRLLEIKKAASKILKREKRPQQSKSQPSGLEKMEECASLQLENKHKSEIKELTSRMKQISTQNESLWKAYSEHQHRIKQLQQQSANLGELNRQILHQVEEKNVLQDRVNDLTHINAALQQQVSTLKNKLRKKNSNNSKEISQPQMISQEKSNLSFADAVLPHEIVEEKRTLLQGNSTSFFRKAKFQTYKLSDEPPNHTRVINSSEDMKEQKQFVYQSPVSNPAEKQANN